MARETFSGLGQIEINLFALLSFCTKPRQSSSRQIFSREGGGQTKWNRQYQPGTHTKKDFRTGLAFHGSTWLCHSYEPLRISGPRRRGPLIGQRFVVPHYSRPTPNQWPKNLRSADLPTLRSGKSVQTPFDDITLQQVGWRLTRHNAFFHHLLAR